MFAVRGKLLKELLEHPEWCRKLDDAETAKDVEKVVSEFARKKGYKIKEIYSLV